MKQTWRNIWPKIPPRLGLCALEIWTAKFCWGEESCSNLHERTIAIIAYRKTVRSKAKNRAKNCSGTSINGNRAINFSSADFRVNVSQNPLPHRLLHQHPSQ